MIPREHLAVAFHDRVCANAGLLVNAIGVGDIDALTVYAKGPTVERTRDGGTLDLSPDAEMRSKVRAERVSQI